MPYSGIGKQSRRGVIRSIGTGVGVGAAGLLAGCMGDDDDDVQVPDDDGEGSVADDGEFTIDAALAGATNLNSLDPAIADQSATWQVIWSMHEGLVRFTDEMELEPHLAEDWEHVDDETITFDLREGVTFHNGDELTADDVQFSLERLIENDYPQSPLWDPLEAVEVEDDYEVTLVTEEPYSPILTYLAGNSQGGAQIHPADRDDDLGSEPIGTGPFEFEEWVEGEHIHVSRHDDYWGDAAYAEEVMFPIIQEDSTAIAAVQSADVDLISRVPHHSVGELDADGDVEIGREPGLNYRMIMFNHDQEPFDDRDVRMAFAQAVNKQDVLDAVWFGEGELSRGPIPPSEEHFSDELEDHQPHDPDNAVSLVDESGYSDEEIDEMELEILTWGDGIWFQFASVAAEQLSETLGIEVTVDSTTFETTMTRLNEQSYDMCSWGYRGYTTADQYILAYYSDSGDNQYRGYENDEVDDLLLEARGEVDVDERRELYLEAQREIVEDVADINLVHANEVQAWGSHVEGYVATPQASYGGVMHRVQIN